MKYSLKCFEGSENEIESLIPSEFQSQPLQNVATDLFELNGQRYSIVVVVVVVVESQDSLRLRNCSAQRRQQ